MLFKNTDRKYLLNIFRLLRGTVFIQALQLLGTFLLTFYFKKENFGVLSFVLSVSTVFEMVTGLQYNTAAIVAKEQKNALRLMLIAVASTIAWGIFLFAAILIASYTMPWVYSNIYMEGFLSVLPFFIISNFIFNNCILLLKYFGKIKAINQFRIFYVIITMVAKFIAAFFFPTVAGLIYAQLLGIAVTALLFILRYHAIIKTTWQQVTFKECAALMKDNDRFPKYAMLSSVINAGSNISFPILITLFFGAHENGVYYLSSLFFFQPLLLLLQAIGDAFLHRAKTLFNDDNNALFYFIKTQQKNILKMLLPYLILAFIAGEFLIPYLLPAQWIEIGKFIKFQIIFYLFTSLYTPFSIIADFMKKQRFLLFFNLSLFLFQFAILYFLHNKLQFNFTILVVSIVSAMHYCFINFYMLKKLKLY